MVWSAQPADQVLRCNSNQAVRFGMRGRETDQRVVSQ